MNALALFNTPKRAIRRFREAHGATETWSAEDHARFQNLLIWAHQTGPLTRLRLRAQALVLIAYALPLYTLAELTQAVRGQYWDRLESYIDRLDDQVQAAEERCVHAGDEPWVVRVGHVTDRVTDVVCRVAGHLARD
ncbi:hypothetical protein [Streptomyces sp. NPDC101393]|uniref:hypothetical protein n=1 Tax=Streptomyces sp. NPDC101393 TaxID=3366141 RepID=UPI0037F49D21